MDAATRAAMMPKKAPRNREAAYAARLADRESDWSEGDDDDGQELVDESDGDGTSTMCLRLFS